MRPLLFVISFLTLSFSPVDLFAIHAIFKGAAPIPRTHGPVQLNMTMEAFLQTVKGEEVFKAIGQFTDEHRYELDPSAYPETFSQVLADFYKDRLFRIEVNYREVKKSSSVVQKRIDEHTRQYGPPRVNSLTGVRLLFWDDGATRMILQVDETGDALVYSLTYIDNDLFHAASRDRVQRETAGRANYGK